jgi:O-antigen ligase
MTKTRGAWFGLAAALCLYSVSHDRRFLVLIALSPLLMFVPAIQERLSDINTPTEFVGEGIIVNSYAWRQLLWEGAYGWFLESPFVGYGLDSFLTFSPQFFVWEPDGVYPHNVYVQTSFELGLIGLFFFVMIFLRLALIVWSGRSVARQPSVLLACLIIFYLLICYSDNILYYLSFNWYYWFMVGVLCCWIRIRRLAVPAAAA